MPGRIQQVSICTGWASRREKLDRVSPRPPNPQSLRQPPAPQLVRIELPEEGRILEIALDSGVEPKNPTDEL